MPETTKLAPGVYVSVTGSPALMRLIPASCQPPITALTSGDAFLPNGSDQTKLVVLLYGWWYSEYPKSASRLWKSCGAGKLPFAFSSDCEPLSFVRESVRDPSSEKSRDNRHSTFVCSAW